MDGINRKGRTTDGHILGSVGSGRAVADPLATMGNHGLTRRYINRTTGKLDMQHALRTTVYSSNSGVWPGSTHPDGLRM
jgi:hypothetical protein